MSETVHTPTPDEAWNAATGSEPEVGFDPWPGTASRVERWLRATMHEAARREGAVSDVDAVRIAIDLEGADVTNASVDASGLRIDVDALVAAAATEDASLGTPSNDQSANAPDGSHEPGASGDGDEVRETAGRLRHGTLRAEPMYVQDWPVWLRLDVTDAPISWVRRVTPLDAAAHRAVGVVFDENQTPAPLTFDAAVERDAITPMLRAIATHALAASETPARLHALEVDIAGSNQHDLTLTVLLSVRLGPFPFGARAVARGALDEDGTLHVRQIDVRSTNPFVALGLLMPPVRRQIRQLAPRTIDLNDLIFGAADASDRDASDRTDARRHLRDVRVELGRRIRITGYVGDPD